MKKYIKAIAISTLLLLNVSLATAQTTSDISINVASNPTLTLNRDTNGNEVSLGSHFTVSVTAPSNMDVEVDASRFEIEIVDTTTGQLPVGVGGQFSFYMNKLSPTKINSFTNATLTSNHFASKAYKISAGTTATFDISSFLINTKLLPAGTYTETLHDITYFSDALTTHGGNGLQGPTKAVVNVTNAVTVTGKKSTASVIIADTGLQTNSTRTLSVGLKGDDVKSLQQFLITKGFLIGNADGGFGIKTKIAVMNFQKANKLTADGKAGKKFRDLMVGIKPNDSGAVVAIAHGEQNTAKGKDFCSDPNAGMTTDANGNISVTSPVFGTTGLDSQVQNVAVGAVNTKLLTIHLVGVCTFKLNHMSFRIGQNVLTNIRLVNDTTNAQIGTTIAHLSSSSAAHDYVATFTPNLSVAAGTTKKLSLYADIVGPNGTSFTITNTSFSTTNIGTGQITGIGYDDPNRGTYTSPILIGTQQNTAATIPSPLIN